MPAIDKPSQFARLRETKKTDLLYARLSRGVTPAQIIEQSELEPTVRQFVAEVCNRTRLWNAERVDVARELIAHFLDARDAGVTSDKAIRAFGDPDAAAQLIRRAKIRNRSLLWHTFRFLRRAMGVLILFYIGLIAYYALGQPRISVDYIAQINEPIRMIPQDQRAWPYYRDFAEAFDADMEARGTEAFDIYPDAGDRRWAKITQWIKDHPQMLALANEASSRPSMGFIYGAEGSVREMKKFKDQVHDKNDPFYNALLSILLPQLNDLRRTANVLASDARLAAEEGDSARWLKRVTQLRRVGEHASETDFLVSQLVHISIETLRLERIQRMLVDHPGLLSDAQLIELAHSNTTYQKPSDLMSYDGERMMFKDVVQRLYTDDGNGDGHLAAQGLASIENLTTVSGPPQSRGVTHDVAKYAVTPAAAMFFASRKDLVEKYEHFLTQIERNINVPWRERSLQPTIDDQVMELKSSSINKFRYLLITVLMPALDRASLNAERCLTSRDAVQAGIALELFRRRNGHYPAAFDELTPMLLPSVPLDPCDGKPMRYKLVDGKPLIYSIGIDLKDDGGAPPTALPGLAKPQTNGYELAIGQTGRGYTGDWILYPQPQSVPEDDEDAPPSTQPQE